MWLTLTVHIAMWPTSKEFTSVTKLVYIIMWLRLNEFWVWSCYSCERGCSQRVLPYSDPYVFCKTLCHIVDAATTFHLELFQIVAPLYVSGISTQSYPDRCQACIDITLCRTLYHLHNRETFPYSSKDNFDRYLVIHSLITFVLSCQTCSKAHIRCGT